VGVRSTDGKSWLVHRQLDAEETGHRTLSGEWVVNKSVWRRLRTEAREREMMRKQRKRERDGMGRSVDLVEKKGAGGDGRKGKEEKVIYYIHGGEFRGRGASSGQGWGLLMLEMGTW